VNGAMKRLGIQSMWRPQESGSGRPHPPGTGHGALRAFYGCRHLLVFVGSSYQVLPLEQSDFVKAGGRSPSNNRRYIGKGKEGLSR
jgi:hypothetical protein